MSRPLLFAVTGNPILYSRSPCIFNELFRKQSIDAVYLRLAARSAGESIDLFKQLGLRGMNVSSPFKESILPHVDIIDHEARDIGAINTILEKDGLLYGYNTDHIGVVAALHTVLPTLAGTTCIVIGAGGAAKAAAYGLLKHGADVTIVNRTFLKAEDVARTFGCRPASFESLEAIVRHADILVTTVPLHSTSLRFDSLPDKLVVLDAIYTSAPPHAQTSTRSCRYISGREWLLQQAVPAFKLFTGIEPDQRLMRSAALRPMDPPKQNISFIGFMCSGKTSVGGTLASKMGFHFLDTDDLVSARAHMPVHDIIRKHGERAFRSLEMKEMRILEEKRHILLACGGGAVLEEANRSVLRDSSLVVWLYSSLDSAMRRLAPGFRPLLGQATSFDQAQALFNARMPFYARTADLVVRSDDRSPDELSEMIYEEIHQSFAHFGND